MFTGTLYGFQEEARKFMVDRGRVLVAYEMGLGKTVITIAAIEDLIDDGTVSCGLVITPSSLKYQWERQIEKFTDGATVMVVDGTPMQRERQYSEALSGEYDYIILNYEQVVNDWDFVRHLPRDFVVCDEVTAIKGFKAKRSRRVKKLQADFLFGLSGQPIENKPEEAFSIMEWIDPEVLGRFDIFDKAFIVRNHWGKVERYRNLPTFGKKMAEAMVRKKRTDPDVRDQLPKVSEESHLIQFDAAGATLYRTIAAALENDLAQAMSMFSTFDLWGHYSGKGEDTSANWIRGEIMSKLTCLRMLCDHGELLRISAAMYTGHAEAGTGVQGGSKYAAALQTAGKLSRLPKSPPKMTACMETIEEILSAAPENKIVLFSFFKATLRLLQDATAALCGSVRFTGDMTAKARDDAKMKFQADPYCRLFLSSDAGGYGVDLPEANYIINYDMPWSAGKLDQRNSRIVRLSSEFEAVTVINFLMQGSIEERQYDMLVQKRKIASAFMDGKGYDAKGRLDLSLSTLTEFLQTSAV